MNRNLTEIVFILDRSGSMAGLESDTIGGFNAMVEKQKKEKGEAVRYACDGAGTSLNFKVASRTIARVRSGEQIEEDWCADIAEDYERRGR